MASILPTVFVIGPVAIMKKPGILFTKYAEAFVAIPRIEKSVLIGEVPVRIAGTLERTVSKS